MAVVRGLDLRVERGEVVALIGPNGAGKTTTLLTLSGELPPIAGEVCFNGAATKAPLFKRARRGLGFVTEERSVFMGLSTADNLRLAGRATSRRHRALPGARATDGSAYRASLRRRATDARAGPRVARKPTMLLADELSLGLAPLIVQRLLRAVRDAADQRGLGVLLVEQHVRQALQTADRVYVMQRGEIAIQGTAAEVHGRLDELEATYLAGTTDGTAPGAD